MLLTRVSLQHSLRAASETERHTVTNITHSPRLEQSHATWRSRKQAQYLGCGLGDGKKCFSYSILASTSLLSWYSFAVGEGGCFTWICVKIGRCKYVVSRALLGLTASLAAEVHLYVELSLKPSMFYRFLSCQVQWLNFNCSRSQDIVPKNLQTA